MQYHLPLHSSFLLTKPLSPLTKRLPFSKTRMVVSAAEATANRQHPVPVSSTTMYELLAVTESAGPEEIKAAYRRQARRWHPDTCRSSEDKEFFAQQFIRTREAYRVLSDPVLREDYDYELRTTSHNNASAATNAGVIFRKMGRSATASGGGFGDWEAQLQGLKVRSSSPPSSWGSRMRSARRSRPSDF